MIENITANYVSSELKAIREAAASKSNLPFLLLPVRLEARFMKVDKPIVTSEEALLERLLSGLGKLQISFLEFSISSLNSQVIIKRRIAQLSEDIRELQQYTTQISEVTRKQKSWLIELSQQLDGRSQAFISLLNTRPLRALQRQLNSRMKALLANIKLIKEVQDPVFSATADLLNAFKKVEKQLRTINQKQLPYTNLSNKKDLYTYVEKVASKLKELYSQNDHKITSIRRIKNNQLSRLRELHQQLKQETTQFVETIKSAHPDQPWQQFTQKIETQLSSELGLSRLYFENNTLPKLTHLAEIKHIDSASLCYSSVRTLINISQLNTHRVDRNIKNLRKTRKTLNKNIIAVQKMGSQIVEATPKQVKIILNLWKEIDQSVHKYDTKINATVIKNPSHLFSVKSTVGLLNNHSLSIQSNLFKSSESNTDFLSGQDFDNSQTIFNQINTKAKNINSFVRSNNIVQANLSELKSNLTELNNLFQVSTRKRLPIAKRSLNTTKKLLNDLTQSLVGQDLHTNPEISQLVKDLQSSIDKGVVVIDTPGINPSIQVALPTQQVNELWVRIFPDDIHIQTHEKDLTADEISSGKQYWLAWWAASNEAELELAAWKLLVSNYDSQRAAWIAKSCDPTKIAANQPSLSNKPSTDVLAANTNLKATNKLLKNVMLEHSAIDIFNNVDIPLVLTQMQALKTLLANIQFEQANPLSQIQGQLSLFESKLLLIKDQVNNASPAEFNLHSNLMADLVLIFSTYEEVQQSFSNIEKLDITRFIARFNEPLTFPNLQPKQQDWSQAPHTSALPDRFTILTQNKGKYHHMAVGKPIPKNLHVGLDPETFDFDSDNDNPFQLDSQGNLQVDEGMRWMVDFEEAVSKGMGLKIPLSNEDAEQGFDRILAIGITDNNSDQKTLEELFENHHYAADGMSFVAVETPTNNTDQSAAGFNSIETDPDESYRVEMGTELFDSSEVDPLKMTDGKRLADALGINANIFQHIQYSDNLDISWASAIHRSLWHVSIGDYMESSWDHLFSYDTIERTYQFFTNNVIGRGALPTIRVGTQPYGILPTTAFSKMQFDSTFNEDNLPTLSKGQVESPGAVSNKKLQLRYDINLKKMLIHASTVWNTLQEQKVKHAYNVPDNASENEGESEGELPTPQQHFIEMLGLQASSVEYFYRYGINIAYRGTDPDNADFSFDFKDENYGPVVMRNAFNDIVDDGYFYKSFDFYDEQDPDPDSDKQLVNKANRIHEQFQNSRIFNSRYIDHYTQINGPLIDTQVLSKTNTVEKSIKHNNKDISYIEWLLTGANSLYDILERNDFSKLPSNSMLFMLLRQSLLLAFRESALNIMQDEGFFNEHFRRKIGSSDNYQLYSSQLKRMVFTSKWTFLFRDPKVLNGIAGYDFSKHIDGSDSQLFAHLNNGSRSLADFVLNKSNLFNTYPNKNKLEPYINRAEDIRAAIAVLDTIPTQTLNQLMAEHIDVSSYRLDAWLLGLANKRLKEQRQGNRAKGIHLGAYGWLEDLRPGGARQETPNLPAQLTPEDRSPVYTDADNEGFIHAPSINQAISAAVLRSGYTASRGTTGNLDNQMAVNLSSRRVRMALKLVEGISNGLSLGSILGFQFERNLHESYKIAELDRFIYGFRELFPLVVPIDITTESAPPNTNVNVVDGYALLEEVDKHIATLENKDTDRSVYDLLTADNYANCPVFIISVVDSLIAPDETSEVRNLILQGIIREVDRIGDALDALGDLTISESVYQIVQGNHVRAAAMVEALAAGNVPSEFQFVNTPRTGVIVTQRAILNLEPLNENSPAPAGWPATLSQRAKVEPSLNNWLASLLGAANQIRVIAYNTTQAPDSPLEITIGALNLQAIDLVYLLGFNPEQGTSELENRVAWHIRSKHTFLADDTLTITFSERLDHWTLETKTIYELSPLIKNLKNMLTNVKYVDALDLMIPDDDPTLDNPEKLFPSDLTKRVNAAAADYRNVLNSIQEFLSLNFDLENTMSANTVISSAQQNTIRDLLFKLSEFGVPNSVPAPQQDTNASAGQEILSTLITSTRLANKRLNTYEQKHSLLAKLSTNKQVVEALIEMGQILFEKNMVLLPHYQPQNKSDILQQINLTADSSLVRHRTDPHVFTDWLQDLSTVRPGLYSLDMSAMLTQNFNQEFPDFYPVQFPFRKGDYWLGIEYPPEEFTPEGDYLSLSLFNHAQLTANNDRKVGIIVDEWTEVIPQENETTGIAYHYDNPDAQAPQNLLLAINPDIENKWDWNSLVNILNETLDLAKIRAVEPDHLDSSIFAQVLPAIISEVVPPQARNYDDDNAETGKTYSNPLGTQVVMDFVDNTPTKED